VALSGDSPDFAFSGKELELLRYAKKLTLAPNLLSRKDVEALRSAGASDGEILEANQVVSYFNYANRVLNGLGVTTEGDVLGTSPRTKK
jgi:alkylhydroperoxidase family enzyme